MSEDKAPRWDIERDLLPAPLLSAVGKLPTIKEALELAKSVERPASAERESE